MNTKSKKVILLLGLGILLVLLAYLMAKILTIINYKCPWRHLFHVICAGCGVTRMVKMLFKLEFYNAFLYNPLFFILLIIAFLYYVHLFICIIFDKKIIKIKPVYLYVFAFVMVAFMIMRNIKGSPLYDIWPK